MDSKFTLHLHGNPKLIEIVNYWEGLKIENIEIPVDLIPKEQDELDGDSGK
jgi:hypothetical protein